MHGCRNRMRNQHRSGFSRPVTKFGDPTTLALMHFPAYPDPSGKRVG